jgi:hypothetical protein
MAAVKSNKQSSGRFVQGGQVDDVGIRLGWWEPKSFAKSPTDVTIILAAKYNKRPDLLAFDVYGKSGLMWFILQYNTISDITEFTQGLELTLPTKSRLFSGLLTTTS